MYFYLLLQERFHYPSFNKRMLPFIFSCVFVIMVCSIISHNDARKNVYISSSCSFCVCQWKNLISKKILLKVRWIETGRFCNRAIWILITIQLYKYCKDRLCWKHAVLLLVVTELTVGQISLIDRTSLCLVLHMLHLDHHSRVRFSCI